jgi:GrpB-like predicted nucleotidyltransferase (UPF0157 family)
MAEYAAARHLGLESGVVRLVDYDEEWPRLFAAERERLLSFVRAHCGRQIHLEHIGSTAVPGLAAKPVLDMLAAPWLGDDLDPLIPAFELPGYLYRPLQSTPERHFFRRGEPRQYHLHLTPLGSQVWRDHRFPQHAPARSRGRVGVRGTETRPGRAVSHRPRGVHRGENGVRALAPVRKKPAFLR